MLLSDRIVMMTNGPSARIGEVLEVGLPRPRKRLELVANPTYLKAREAVLKFLHERHRFVEAGLIARPERHRSGPLAPSGTRPARSLS